MRERRRICRRSRRFRHFSRAGETERPPLLIGVPGFHKRRLRYLPQLRGRLFNGLPIGPAGTGKSPFILQSVAAAVARGENAMFIFDEEFGLLFERATHGLKIM
jgi:hypothetical protein